MGWALITGASGGIGLKLAEIAAREGRQVIAAARSADRLEELAGRLRQQHGVEALAIPVDLAEADGPDRLWREATAEGREIDILINNAGLGNYGPFAEDDPDREATSVAVNVTALTRLTQLGVQAMRPRGAGRILQIASVAGFIPGPKMAVYNATKAFVISLSESLAEELRGSGVTVTCVCPGVTETGFQEGAGMTGLKMLERSPKQSAADVAEFAWRAMMRGSGVAVPGLSNKAMALSARTAPRSVLARMVGLAMRN